MKKRLLSIIVTFVLLLTAFPNVTVFAKSYEIDFVSIDVHVDSDEEFPIITTFGTEYQVSYVDFPSKGTIKLELTPSSGYRFDDSWNWDKDNFDITGATVSKVTETSEDKISVTLKYTSDQLSKPKNVKWDGKRATWNRVSDADYYEVKYDGEIYETTRTSLSLSSYIYSGSPKTFQVRACSDSSSVTESSWVKSNSRSSSSSSSDHSGWVERNGNWYYYNKFGNKLTGWLDDSGLKYYMDSNGVMVTGWKKISNSWYYFEPSVSPVGHMVSSTTIRINGTLYSFGKDGKLLTDVWIQDSISGSTGWYYIKSDGNRCYNEFFRAADGNTYYAEINGWIVMNTWAQIGDYWYYFYSNGVLARNTYINGLYVDSSGRWIY